MKHFKFSALAAAACLAATAATPASAATAVVSFTGGSVFTGFSSDETVGFKFNTANAISVTQLGWLSTTANVASSHQIGIWNMSGTLLGSATVTPGAVDGTGFRYVGVSPIALAAGDYLIGGRDTTSDGDNYRSSVSSLVMGSGITFLGSAVSANGSGFANPNIINSITTGGRFGPNFTYTLAAVPEPATWAMMIIGFGMAGTAMRTRRRVSVSFG
jgi:hypothetical protein